MNLVQEKVKQRNITPNFLRFRRISINIQAKVKPILSAKRLVKMTKWKLNYQPNAQNVVHQKRVDAVSRHMNEEFYISVN
jgi:hypothetical protein